MDDEYFKAVDEVLIKGEETSSRVGNTISRTGVLMRFNLCHEFPLPRHKNLSLRMVATELAWFLGGHSNVRWLQERGVFIWNDDASKTKERGFDYPEGELGPIYGVQWRGKTPGGVDQLAQLLHSLKTNPQSRRHIVTAWNPRDIDKMVLPPCHHTFQVRIVDEYMDLHLTMRSGDMGLGVPYNIVSYSLLLTLLAKEVGKTARELVITVVDAHIYADHVEPLLQRRCQYYAEKSRSTWKKERISIDLDDIRTVDDFISLHEKNVDFKLQVKQYSHMEKLFLPLHT